MRIRHFLVLLAVAALVAACHSAPQGQPSDAWVGHLVQYRKAVSESHGTVGYVKTWEYENDGKGEPFTLYHVYDVNFVERGVVTEMGTGTKYVDVPIGAQRATGKTREEEPLPAQPLTWNVAQILDVKPDVKLVPVSPAELKAAGEPANAPAE